MIILLVLTFCFGYLIIDHTSVELIDSVCDDVLTTVYDEVFLHYAHTSHGGQIYEGCDSYLKTVNPRYQMWQYSGDLPDEIPVMYSPPGIRFFDGQSGYDYIEPENYWATSDGRDDTRQVLDTELFTHSMFAFCGQMATEVGPSYAIDYTTQMAILETEYPDVTFIYMTGHLPGSLEYPYSDGERENLRQNNEHIRDFVESNDKVLYDFADIEAYYDDEVCLTNSNPEDTMENYNDYPVECDWPETPEFYCAHTVGYNCLKKAKAFWFLMASLVKEDPLEETCDDIVDDADEEDEDSTDEDDDESDDDILDDGVGFFGVSIFLH